jgi:hypothetical protein
MRYAVAWLVLLYQISLFGQGTLRLEPTDGQPVVAALGNVSISLYMAQAYFVSANGVLTPLSPPTTMTQTPERDRWLVQPVTITIPTIPGVPLASATFRVRVWDSGSSSYDTATERAEFPDATFIPWGPGGSDVTISPTLLPIPEPAAAMILELGLAIAGLTLAGRHLSRSAPKMGKNGSQT